MCSYGSSRQYCGVLRFYSPYLYIRILCLKYLAYSCNGSACSDSRTESMYRSRNLFHNLQCRMVLMCHRIIFIGKLLRHKYSWVFLLHPECCLKTFIYACAYISGIMYQFHIRTIMSDKFSSFFAHRIRHNYYRPVSLNGTHKRQPYSLIAAGRLNYYSIFLNEALSFCFFNHIECSSCLNRTSDIHCLEFNKYLRRILLNHTIQPYHRSVSDSFKNIIVNHK